MREGWKASTAAADPTTDPVEMSGRGIGSMCDDRRAYRGQSLGDSWR
jgi:hypothetical protein